MRLLRGLVSVVIAFHTAALTAQSVAPSDSNLVFANVGNAALLMDVYRPARSNGLGILFISGSGWGGGASYTHGYDDRPLKDDAKDRDSFEGRLVQELASRGFTVFAINHRFAPEVRFPLPVYDAQRAVRFVRANASRYGIDPAHLGAIGHSSGGHLAAMLGLLDTTIVEPKPHPYQQGSSRVQAVVTISAPFVVTEVLLTRPGMPRIISNLMGPLPAPTAAGTLPLEGEFAAASPLTRVTAQSAPFLIYQAENDSTVLKSSAPMMAKALDRVGVPHRVVMRANGGHYPDIDLDEIEAWFKKYLR